jgi:hypothetical protein
MSLGFHVDKVKAASDPVLSKGGCFAPSKTMKRALLFVVLTASSPVLAQQWDRYVNERYGTVMTIPPGFNVEIESTDGDGRLYLSEDRNESLLVWGSQVIDESFQAHFESLLDDEKSLGWDITYVAKGDGWRIYSGIKDDRVIYAKILASCEGKQAQHFKFEYSRAEKAELDSVVKRLSGSLKSRKGVDCP